MIKNIIDTIENIYGDESGDSYLEILFNVLLPSCIAFTIFFVITNSLDSSYISKMNENDLTILGDIFVSIMWIALFSILILIGMGGVIFVCLFAIPISIFAIPGIAVVSFIIYLSTMGYWWFQVSYIFGSLTLIIFIVFGLLIPLTLRSSFHNDIELSLYIYFNTISIFINSFVAVLFISIVDEFNYSSNTMLIITMLWLFITTMFTIWFIGKYRYLDKILDDQEMSVQEFQKLLNTVREGKQDEAYAKEESYKDDDEYYD